MLHYDHVLPTGLAALSRRRWERLGTDATRMARPDAHAAARNPKHKNVAAQIKRSGWASAQRQVCAARAGRRRMGCARVPRMLAALPR